MKTTSLIRVQTVVLSVIISSCTSVKQIGNINMISTRNIESNIQYQRISTYSGGSKNELRKSRATSIETAMDNTIRKIPGGEYMMNVKIYLINDSYFAVEGDVWGATESSSYRGFKAGDKVTWKSKDIFHTGVVIALKDDKSCYIKMDGSDKTIELIYDNITKIDSNVSDPKSKPVDNEKIRDPQQGQFTIGQKIKFIGAFGDTYEGKIIELYPTTVIAEYYDSRGKTTTTRLKYNKILK